MPLLSGFLCWRNLFLLLLFFPLLGRASAADISLSPSSGNYKVGNTISIGVFVTGNQDTINAVSASIRFNSDVMELQSISKSGSIIAVWAEEPTFSNASGVASMEGVIFNPGYSGGTGKIATLTFRAKKEGTGNISITSGSVLANDGNATNVTGKLGTAKYTISPKPVSVPQVITPPVSTSSETVKETATTTPEEIVPVVIEINAPEILSYTKNAVVGDEMVVVGKTDPSTIVEVVYTNIKTGTAYAQSFTSDTDGNFTASRTDPLPVGVYEMRARAIDSNGVHGTYTNPRAVQLERQPFLAVGIKIVNWVSLLIILIAALFGLAGIIYYLYGWLARVKRRAKNSALPLSVPQIPPVTVVPPVKKTLAAFFARLPHKE